ncbi:MAG TPA: trigger factor, partial [Rubellimicrobium sp.]|nr:trigger factor [Rubellimicrobium sp.]
HEDHPQEQGHNHDHVEPTEDHLRLARRRVKLGLLLADLGTKAEVKVTDAELTQAVLQQARQYRGQERQFFEYVQQNAAIRQQIQAPIFEDKVIDHIFGAAQVEEKEVSKDELQAAVEKLDEE